MKKIIAFDIAAKWATVLLVLICIFHGLVLLGIIPYKVVWGGRLTDTREMYTFELTSLAINSCIILLVCWKAGWMKPWLGKRLVQALLWAVFALFLLNTIGNIFSLNHLEAIIFTPLTALLCLLFLRLAIEG
jgi:hypothetical protein